jgi:hypothetical protein
MALIAWGMPNVAIVDICKSSDIVDGDGMRGDREALLGLLYASGASQLLTPPHILAANQFTANILK